MPTQGCTKDDYEEMLDEVYEVITKYPECVLIWTGDINADPGRSNLHTNDKKFIKFCNENKLCIAKSMPEKPTFYHFNKTSTSRIDLFIHRNSENPISSIEVHTRQPLNTSPHDSITAMVPAILPSVTAKHKVTTSTAPRVKWEKVDRSKYIEATEVQLKGLQDVMEDMPAHLITVRLNEILTRCATLSCPPPPKRRRKTRFRWSAGFKNLADNAMSAYHDYRKSKDDREKLAKLRAAKKVLRKAQRQASAKRREDIKTAIITSCKTGDKKEFYRLVKKQKNSGKKVAHIDFGDHTAESETNSWAKYFSNLATPADDETFDEDYNTLLDVNYLLQSLTASNEPLPAVSEDDVRKITGQLKNGKSPDVYGISSEHIKLAAETCISILTYLTNNALTTGKLPDNYKLGSVCPVPKKAKSPKLPTNYRSITITSIVGKVIEIHMVNITRSILNPQQNPCQFGFTAGNSPIYAALILTEVMAEAVDEHVPLYIALMDTSKAFDVVDHRGMLNALHLQGVQGQLWKLYESLYTNIESTVKWKNETSHPFKEQQGIRQGGSSSADIYKCGKNRLLNDLLSAPCNHIGHIPVGAIMVADDLMLNSKCTYKLQTNLRMSERDAARERYKFNVDKTKIIPMNCNSQPNLILNKKPLGCSDKEPHLGITRNNTNSNGDTICSRVMNARRSLYSLLGAGFSGLNGIGPDISVQGYETYVAPILLYGLEAVVLSETDTKALTTFHRKVLRRLQYLPESTAIAELHLLSGSLPIKAMIHKKALSLLRNIIAADTKSPPALYMRDLIIRQLAMTDPNSASWTAYIRRIIREYNLPCPESLITNPPTKIQWKKTITRAIHDKWTEKLKEEAATKSSLAYLNVKRCSTSKMHPVWLKLESTLDVRKASVKAKLLVQRYPLATSRTAGPHRTDVCPLCKKDPETMTHFLLHCPVSNGVRGPYIHRILNTCRNYRIPIDEDSLTRIILDSNYLPMEDLDHEATCRNLTYKLHNLRTIYLGGVSRYKAL